MLKTYLFFTAFLLCYNLSFSQSLIRGIVVDDQSIPITDAHVYFTAIPIGMVTDSEGRFELESDNSFKSFEVSYVGMKLVKIDIQSQVRFFRLDLIWKGPHRSLNGPQSPELGFRLSVRPTF